MKCDSCGNEITIGCWPFCPHEDARGCGEDPLGYIEDWNITQDLEPKVFGSRAERRRYMSKHGLDSREKGHRLGQVIYFAQG